MGDEDDDYYGYEAERARREAYEKTRRYRIKRAIRKKWLRVANWLGLQGADGFCGPMGPKGDRGDPGIVDANALVKLIETDLQVQQAILALHSKTTT